MFHQPQSQCKIARRCDQRVQSAGQPTVSEFCDEHPPFLVEAMVELDETRPLGHDRFPFGSFEVTVTKCRPNALASLLHRGFEGLVDLARQYVDVVEITQQILKSLALLHHLLCFVHIGTHGLEQIAQALPRYAALVKFFEVAHARDLAKGDQQVGGVSFCEIRQTSSEAGLCVFGKKISFAAQDRKPPLKPIGSASERSSKFVVQCLGTLTPPFEKHC